MSDYPPYLSLCNSAGGVLDTYRAHNATEAARLMARWVETFNDGDTVKINKSITDIPR